MFKWKLFWTKLVEASFQRVLLWWLNLGMILFLLEWFWNFYIKFAYLTRHFHRYVVGWRLISIQHLRWVLNCACTYFRKFFFVIVTLICNLRFNSWSYWVNVCLIIRTSSVRAWMLNINQHELRWLTLISSLSWSFKLLISNRALCFIKLHCFQKEQSTIVIWINCFVNWPIIKSFILRFICIGLKIVLLNY